MTGPLLTNIYLNLLCYVYLKIKEIIHYLITIPLYMYIHKMYPAYPFEQKKKIKIAHAVHTCTCRCFD